MRLGGILFQNLVILPQVSGSDMESGQRISQAGGGQIAHQQVKYSQGAPHFSGVVSILNGIERLRRMDKAQGPPEGALGIDPIVQAFLGGNYPGQLPMPNLKGGMRGQAPLNVIGKDPKVLHDQLRAGENPGIQALQDKLLGRRIAGGDEKRVIDIAPAERHRGHPTLRGKTRCGGEDGVYCNSLDNFAS